MADGRGTVSPKPSFRRNKLALSIQQFCAFIFIWTSFLSTSPLESWFVVCATFSQLPVLINVCVASYVFGKFLPPSYKLGSIYCKVSPICLTKNVVKFWHFRITFFFHELWPVVSLLMTNELQAVLLLESAMTVVYGRVDLQRADQWPMTMMNPH